MGLGSIGAIDVKKITDDQLIAFLENKANLSNKVLYGLALTEATKRGYDTSGFDAFLKEAAAPAAGSAPPAAKKSNVGKYVAIAAAGIGGLLILMMVLKRK